MEKTWFLRASHPCCPASPRSSAELARGRRLARNLVREGRGEEEGGRGRRRGRKGKMGRERGRREGRRQGAGGGGGPLLGKRRIQGRMCVPI